MGTDEKYNGTGGLVVDRPGSSAHETPLLFVHGMCHGAWCWQEHYLPYFADKGYTAYAIDLPGHGSNKSDKKLRKLSLAEYVSSVEKAVEHIGTPPVLIGHSMGGRVVQKYMETHRVPAGVLFASVPPRNLISNIIRFAKRRFRTFMRINLNRSLYPLVETPERTRELMFSRNLPDELVKKYQFRMQDESFRAFLDMVILDPPHPDRIMDPLLVLGAENDALVAVEDFEYTVRTYQAEGQLFPLTGHDMMLDTEWKHIADRIHEWFRENNL